jgi:VIT family
MVNQPVVNAEPDPPGGSIARPAPARSLVERTGRGAGARPRLNAAIASQVPWRRPHAEEHLSFRSNRLQAAVLGANDVILSTSSLVLGVAASGASGNAVVTAGVAGLFAGAGSMAAGEYVSVSSQRDTENADLALEARELTDDPEGELAELASSSLRTAFESQHDPPSATEVAAAA